MFLFHSVKHIIETEIEIYEILLILWVDPQYPWSQGIGSPIWGSSMTRVKLQILDFSYFQDGMKTIEHFNSYIEELVGQLSSIKQRQDLERRKLIELRDQIKTSITAYKEVSNMGGTRIQYDTV